MESECRLRIQFLQTGRDSNVRMQQNYFHRYAVLSTVSIQGIHKLGHLKFLEIYVQVWIDGRKQFAVIVIIYNFFILCVLLIDS